MGACNNKSNSQESSFQSSFSSFIYFNRTNGKIIQLHKKKLTKTKPKSKFFYSQDTSICHLSNRRLLLVGGSVDGELSDESSIISLTSYKITNNSRVPFKCRLGNLHEHGDWVYYLGAHLSMNGRQPAPIIRYNLKTNTWHEISELNNSIRNLINFGSCFVGKEIMIVGGEVVDGGDVKANKEILVVSLDKGFEVGVLGEFPVPLAFPLLAAGEKHGIVIGGVNLKSRAPSRKGYYVLLKDRKVEVHLLDKVAVDVLENYPPVYTKDYALFISYPNVVVRFKSQTQWATFSLKSNKSKSTKNQFSWIKQQRLDFLKVTETSNASHILKESKKKKSKSSSSSSSSSHKKKKKTEDKTPHHELSVKEKVTKQFHEDFEGNKHTSDAEVFEDITIDPIKINSQDSLNINDHLQPAQAKKEFPKITVTRLDSEPSIITPAALSSSTINLTEANPSRSSIHSLKESPLSNPDSPIDRNSSNPSNSNQAEHSNPPAVDSGSQLRLKPEVTGSPRHNSEVIKRRNTPIHVKSLSSPDVLKFEGGNAINKVEITIKKRLSNIGKMLTEYTIKKQSSYSDSSSSSSSAGSKSGKKAKEFEGESQTVKQEKFKPGCVAEFLNISPRNNPSLILEGAENSRDSESSSSSSSKSSSSSSSKSSSSSGSESSDSDSGSSDDSSSESFPIPTRVKRTHTIVSVNSSDVSDEDNDESINYSQEQFDSFSLLVSSTLHLPAKLTQPKSFDIHSLYQQLQSSIPPSLYSLSSHFIPLLSSIHEVAHKLPLKEKEKWTLVLTSHLLPEDDEMSSSQLSYALSRAFKYILLRAR